MIENLHENTVEAIRDAIATELLKRGFIAPITLEIHANNRGEAVFALSSEPFQTTPVLFKNLEITSFGASAYQSTKHEDWVDIWVCVHLNWQLFDGRSNGTTLFNFFCGAKKNDEFGAISRVTIS